MLNLKNLTFTYKHIDSPALKCVNLDLDGGKLILIEGATGSGKSTLLKAINGLVPHFTGGKFVGSISIDGRDLTGLQPHELAEVVAYVNQQPESAFATDTVEEELAFSLEQLGWAPAAMGARIQQLAETFSLQKFLKAPLSELSGGQQQRVAIASALAAGQKLLLLDEPTSALDSASTESLIRLLSDLSKNERITVLIAEHRLERLLPYVDQRLKIESDGSVTNSARGLDTVRPLRETQVSAVAGENVFACRELEKVYPSGFTLRAFDLTVSTHQITGVLGENGSGKTTLLWSVLEESWRQNVDVAMVPQNAQDLLFLSTVSEELAEADARVTQGAKRASRYLTDLVGRIDPHKHPRDLSAGQQLALVLAIQLSTGAKTLILDEPTRGLDSRARQALADSLHSLRGQGHSILIATHDRDFLENVSDRKFLVENGAVSEIGEH
jgi:energy-coupling factor transport system ATP-binding protein